MRDYELVEDVQFVDERNVHGRLVSAEAKELYKSWLENRRDDGLLDASSFTLENYPKTMRHLAVMDVVDECRDLRIHSLGSELTAHYPNAVGKLFSEAAPPGLFTERTLKICHAVFATGRVLVNGPTQARFPGLEGFLLEALYVPMTLTGKGVERIMIVNVFWAART